MPGKEYEPTLYQTTNVFLVQESGKYISYKHI